MAFGGGLGGLTKRFNFSQIFKIGMTFVMLDLQSNMINSMQGIGAPIKALAGISLSLAKFGLMAKMGKGLPFGLGSILTTLTGIQAMTYAISQFPAIMQLFQSGVFTGTTYTGPGIGGPAQGPFGAPIQWGP